MRRHVLELREGTTRREVLRWSAAAAVLTACRARPAPRAMHAVEALAPDERATLAAACERILPRDGSAGAVDAGVIEFLDAQLMTKGLAPARRQLRAGLRLLDAMALDQAGAVFAQLGPDAQDLVLEAAERGEGTTSGLSSSDFFLLLLTLTLEGVFCDPSHGGNRGGVGWALLGIEPPQPRPGGHHG